MKLFDMGASVIVAISVVYFGGWLFDKAKPSPTPQCMVTMKAGDNTVQRWRDCTPEEIKAMGGA